MLEQGVTKVDVAAKYTDGGKSTKETGRSRKARGWDNTGLKRFNALCKLVQRDRHGSHAEGFHMRYQGYRQSRRDLLRGNKKARKVITYRSDAEVVEEVFHEMEDDLVGVTGDHPSPSPEESPEAGPQPTPI